MLCDFGSCHRLHSRRNSVLNLTRHQNKKKTCIHKAKHPHINMGQNQKRTFLVYCMKELQSRTRLAEDALHTL